MKPILNRTAEPWSYTLYHKVVMTYFFNPCRPFLAGLTRNCILP